MTDKPLWDRSRTIRVGKNIQVEINWSQPMPFYPSSISCRVKCIWGSDSLLEENVKHVSNTVTPEEQYIIERELLGRNLGNIATTYLKTEDFTKAGDKLLEKLKDATE
jgi:hypothetical protein